MTQRQGIACAALLVFAAVCSYSLINVMTFVFFFVLDLGSEDTPAFLHRKEMRTKWMSISMSADGERAGSYEYSCYSTR